MHRCDRQVTKIRSPPADAHDVPLVKLVERRARLDRPVGPPRSRSVGNLSRLGNQLRRVGEEDRGDDQ